MHLEKGKSGESRVWRGSLTMCQGFPGHGEKIKDTDSSTPENSSGGGERGDIWGWDGKERPCVALLMNHSWSVLLGHFDGSEFSFHSVQFSLVAQSCPTLCDPMDHSTPGLPVHHQLPEFTQAHVHWVSDAMKPSHPLSLPSPALHLSQHQVFSLVTHKLWLCSLGHCYDLSLLICQVSVFSSVKLK